ncbi:MAG TPA: hypothetical protein VGV61_10810, partial [Thermoanaerobaculia bacterium]|nr:hypothetical protein [Thermoanaerobaculia bacterium]
FAAAWRDDGTLVFAWVVEPPVRLGRPPGTWQLLVRSFADSRPLGPALRVASVKDREGFALILSSIAVDPAGRVLIAWLDYEALHASTAWAQLVSPRGTASGARFAVASPESAEHAFAFCANAAWSGEAWLVAWAAADKPFVDQRSNRSFLRRFSGR